MNSHFMRVSVNIYIYQMISSILVLVSTLASCGTLLLLMLVVRHVAECNDTTFSQRLLLQVVQSSLYFVCFVFVLILVFCLVLRTQQNMLNS